MDRQDIFSFRATQDLPQQRPPAARDEIVCRPDHQPDLFGSQAGDISGVEGIWLVLGLPSAHGILE